MGRGYSKARSLSGRLPNKLKRGIRALSSTNQKRTRSDVSRTEHEVSDNKSAADRARSALASPDSRHRRQKPVGGVVLDAGETGGVSTRQGAVNNYNGGGGGVEDGGVAAHRNIVAQVRARSAMLRQRVLRSSTAPSKRGHQWAPNNNAGSGSDDDDEDLQSEPDDERVARPEVLVKYKSCGKVTDRVLERLVQEAKPGVSVFALCELGDGLVMDLTASTYSKAKDPETGEPLKRGIAFPTNVSVNNMLCHQRPLSEDHPCNQVLRAGDVVKIHVGAHIDGFSTQAARTIVVVPDVNNGNNQQDGVKQQEGGDDDAAAVTTLDKVMDEHYANTVAAAHYALSALVRAMRPGALGSELTDLIRSFGSGFGVEGCEGVLSNRTKRWILDGSQCIINRRVVKEEPQQDVAETEVEPFQVWTLDVAFTSGQSHRLTADETTIFRRTEVPTPNEMRIRAAESVLREVRSTFLCFPFCPTQSDLGTSTARLGVAHLSGLGLVDGVPPMRGKHGVVTARAACTIAITDKRIHILSGAPVLDATAGRSCVELPPQLVDLVHNTPLSFKNAGGAAGGEEADDGANNDGAAGEGVTAAQQAAAAAVSSGVAKNREFVDAQMARVPRGGHTAQQLSALLPPSRKKNTGGDSDGKKDETTGRRAVKSHRVEDD